MGSVFWSGRLSLPMRIMVQANCALSWALGGARDSSSMKARMQGAYDAVYGDNVQGYDIRGGLIQERSSAPLLEEVQIDGQRVLDVGAGTGILGFACLEAGAESVVCTDLSQRMLDEGRLKATTAGAQERMHWVRADAEDLPFAANSFDLAVAGMLLGLVPDAPRALAEMVRVARPGGVVAIATHGPECYWEAVDTSFRALLLKPRMIGYRVEYWPRKEDEVARMLNDAGLDDVRTRTSRWTSNFADGGEAYDVFAALSGSFWYGRLPPHRHRRQAERDRRFWIRRGVTEITHEVVTAVGSKPV